MTDADDVDRLVEDLRRRLVDAAKRHIADIPAADCMLYAEAAMIVGELAAATRKGDE